MSKIKRRNAFSGTVLIMVLTVMVVLIIMLMATLTVVSTAGQRIYTKYEENQAYYTARSALDVFTSNMFSDAAYIAYDDSGSKRKFEYTDTDGTEKDSPMKQGLALQLDLYKIMSQNEDGIDLQFVENAVAGDGTFASGSKEEANYTLSSSTGLPYIEYEVTLPKTSDGSNEYGKIVDIDINDEDGDGDRTEQIARIKVEVLDRQYATNPSYEAAVIDRVLNGTPQAGDPTSAEILAAVANGSRSKDYMKIKITSTVKMMGVDGEAIVIFETTEKDTPATDQALTATGGFSGGSGAQVRAAGGAATMSIGTTIAGDGNNMSGSMFTLGKFEWTSSAATKLNKNEIIVAMDGIAISGTGNPTKIDATGTGSFAFLGGESMLSNGGWFGYDNYGTATNPLPVIADKIVKLSDTDMYVNGDMYVNTFEIQASNANKVHIANNSYIQNIVLPNSNQYTSTSGGLRYINMSAMDDMHIQLCSGYSFSVAGSSDVYNASNYGITWEALGMDSTTFNSTYVTSTTAFDINTYTTEKKDGKIYRKYVLPFNVNSSNEITVPTAQAYFGEYFKDGAFHETTGELKNFSDQANDDPTDPNNAYSVIYSNSNKNSWLYSAADMLAEYLELPDINPGDPARTITSMITNSEITNLESMPNGGTISLDSGDKFFIFDSTYYNNCHWNVTGSNGRVILIIPEGQTVKFDNCEITTDDINLSTVNIKNGVTKAPRVDIYAGTGAKFDTANNNFFAAYFMMPTAEVYMNNGRSNVNYTNNSGATTSINNVCIVGSVLCGDFSESNQSGIVYLNKDSGAETPGDPHLSIKASQYTRK
ncbi:MAG: hypothetical protein ACI4KG_03525 [Oscillospiraceae bacterium]